MTRPKSFVFGLHLVVDLTAFASKILFASYFVERKLLSWFSTATSTFPSSSSFDALKI